jgi:hypothetical protein
VNLQSAMRLVQSRITFDTVRCNEFSTGNENEGVLNEHKQIIVE